MFLWRDKERGADDQEQDGEVVNLKLAKHRNGPTGEIELWFKKKQTRFVQLRRRTLRGSRCTAGPTTCVSCRAAAAAARTSRPCHRPGPIRVRPWKPPRTGWIPSASTSSGVRTRAGTGNAFGSPFGTKSARLDLGPRPRLRVGRHPAALEQDAAIPLRRVLGRCRSSRRRSMPMEMLGQPREGGAGRRVRQARLVRSRGRRPRPSS